MKRSRVLIVVALMGVFLFLTQLPGFAEETSTANDLVTPTLSQKTHDSIENHTHTYVDTDTDTVDDGREPFDYGVMLNVILAETKNTEWGIIGSHEFQTKETRAYLGGKIYLNRVVSKKYKEEI